MEKIFQKKIAELFTISDRKRTFPPLKSLQKGISVPIGFSRGACHVRSRHPTADAAGGMRSPRATACWASSACYHNVIEHEGVGKGAPRGKAALAFSSCSHRRRCDATVATEARRERRSRARAGRRDDRQDQRGLGAVAAQPPRRQYGRSIAIAARGDDAADSMLGLAAAVGGCLSFAPAESDAAHTGCSGAGAAATPLMRTSRSA